MTDNTLKLGYDAVHGSMTGSPTLRSLWRKHATGEDFPDEFFHISFVTVKQLEWMMDRLRVRTGDTLVDAGCGLGGPALWMAKNTGADLIGLDISSVAIDEARARAARLGLAEHARFAVASFDKTGLDSSSVDAIMSEDAIQYAPDKRAVMAEFARILRPGGRLVFAAFEIEPAHVTGLPVLGVDPVDDYRPLLQDAGFTVETYLESPAWSSVVRDTYQSLLDSRDALAKEMGEVATFALCSELTMTLEAEPYRRRMLVAATRN